MRILTTLFLALFAQISALKAADFEIGPQDGAESHERGADRADADRGIPAAKLPLRLEVGDVPTAYALKKYGLRTDLKFHQGGGILAKAWLGLFERFMLGGAVEIRHFIGDGDVDIRRDDAQLLAKLLVLREDRELPALAIGWDGPAYESGEAKGLYVALSKEFSTALAFFQLHAGANSGQFERFKATRDLRAFLGLSTSVYNVSLFTEVDEVLNTAGSRWNAGLLVHFQPVSLGLEFRDLASLRPGVTVSRLLRVSWDGRF